MRSVRKHLHDRAAGEELRAGEIAGHVTHRQVQLLDCEEAAAVHGDQSAAVPHEGVEGTDALPADASRVARRHRSWCCSVDDPATADVGQHDHVVALAEIAGAHVGVVQADRLEVVVLQEPACPAFVDARRPRSIQAHARPTYLGSGGTSTLGLQCQVRDHLGDGGVGHPGDRVACSTAVAC